MIDSYITLKEASSLTGIPDKTLRTWAKQGRINVQQEAYMGSFKYVILRSEAEQLVRKSTQVQQGPTGDKKLLAQAYADGVITYEALMKALREGEKREEDPYDHNWLIIGDIHAPFDDHAYFEFCLKQKKRFGATRFIFTGDEHDGHHISFHKQDPNGLGAKRELKMAVESLKKWHDNFPEAIVFTGNHSSLPFRKAFDMGLPSEWVRSLNDVLEVPTWNYVVEYENSRFRGGHGDDGKNMNVKLITGGKPYIQGHFHSASELKFLSESLWSMQVGCGVDKNSYAFGYAGKGAKRFIHTVGHIVEGDPMLVARR